MNDDKTSIVGDYTLFLYFFNDLDKSNINYKIYPGHGDSTCLFDEKNMLESYIK